MRTVLPLIGVLVLLSAASPARAADVRLERVGRFSQPVYVTSPPGAQRTLVVVERYGRIRLVVRGHVQRRLLADLRARVRIDDPDEEVDQRGLFSAAFPRDYRRSGRFYVQYVDRAGHERVDELRRGSRRVRRVLDLGRVGTQHHGGQLQFGPDRRLYVSTGMDTPRHPGSLLRLDPRRRPARPQVYASGLRNPWRFSFDRSTGALLIGDVGDHTAEEVDVLAPGAAAGADFGWPTLEGDLRRAPDGPVGSIAPALALRHADGWCAITGGYVVRDRRLRALAGRYVFADLCSGRIWSAALAGAALQDARPLGLTAAYPVSFGEDARGRVYVVSFCGEVVRLRAR
jgi:glucose/arabinose dehydrogenase